MAGDGREVVRDPRRSNAPICTGRWPDGNPCGMIAERGKTKCRRHGGKSVSGLAHGNFKHGRYSKDLPTALAARAAEAAANPRLLSLSDDIAVTEARLADLLRDVEQGVCWDEVVAALAAFDAAQAAGDWGRMDAQFAALRGLVARGQAGQRVWQDIRQLWATRGKLVQIEVKTLQGLQQLVTVQQQLLLLGALTQAVVEAVERYADKATGRQILKAVQAEVTRLATLEERR
jgi:hypothetical protein